MDETLKRDAAVVILFGAAFLLVLFDVASALLFGALGMEFFWMAKAAMLLTGAFAMVGAGFGLMRAKRRGRAITR